MTDTQRDDKLPTGRSGSAQLRLRRRTLRAAMELRAIRLFKV